MTQSNRAPKLSSTEQNKIVSYMVEYCPLATAQAREIFLLNADLKEVMGKLNLQDSIAGFWNQLLLTCERVGFLKNSNEYALIILLKYIHDEVVSGQEDPKNYLNTLLSEWTTPSPHSTLQKEYLPNAVSRQSLIIGGILIILIILFLFQFPWFYELLAPSVTSTPTRQGLSVSTRPVSSTLIATSPSTPDIINLPDKANLDQWLLNVAEYNLSTTDLQSILLINGIIDSSDDLQTTMDLTGDQKPDWIILPSIFDDACKDTLMKIYIIDPDRGQILISPENIQGQHIDKESIQYIDITSDSVTDVLYKAFPCMSQQEYDYHLFTTQNNGSNELYTTRNNSYLALFEAEDIFRSQNYSVASMFYIEIPRKNTPDWGTDPATAQIAIRRFVAVRLILITLRTKGIAESLTELDNYKGLYGENDPYIEPLEAMIQNYTSDDLTRSCEVFRTTVEVTLSNPYDLTTPLNKLGEKSLTYQDVCPE